jgi:drug/metabolite transporter (DMT)-like permease
MRSETRGLILAVAAALCFATKAIFVKLAYPYGVGPVALLTLRMLFALPVFAAVAVRGQLRGPRLSRRDLWALVGLGIVGYYAASILDFIGLQYITAGLERLIVFTYPTLTLLIAVFAFGRPFDRQDVVALAVTWAGVALAFAHDLELTSDHGAAVIGGAYVFAGAVCYALYIAGAGEIVARVGSMRASAFTSCVSTAVICGHLALTHPLGELLQPAPVLWLALTMAVVSTVLPVFMQMAAIEQLGAARSAVVSTVGPVCTIALGAIVLDEPTSLVQLLGTVLVLVGVTLAGRPRGAPLPAAAAASRVE